MPVNDKSLHEAERKRDERRFHDLTHDEWDTSTTQGPNSSSSFGVSSGSAVMSGGFAGKGPRGYQRSDVVIHDDICGALERNGDIDATDIEVEVSEGAVTLSGRVPDRRMKRLAEDISENLPGVREVMNLISVRRD